MATPVLSARLAAVAACVPTGRPMADIGTDHAHLPTWLVATGRVPSAIGIDVAPGPLAGAAATSAEVDGVQVRLGDGLTPLHDDEVETIVIAGMGGARMRTIVDEGMPRGVSCLVLQPNTQWAATRSWIATHGWTLRDEAMVEDRDKFYVVLTVDLRPCGAASGWTDADLELGPILRGRADPTWRRWVEHTRARLRRAQRDAVDARPEDPARAALERRLRIFDAT